MYTQLFNNHDTAGSAFLIPTLIEMTQYRVICHVNSEKLI